MYTVKENSLLLEYILKYIEPNRKKAKAFLKNKSIFVNHKNITQFNFPIYKNDTIEIKKFTNKYINATIPILYEDDNIIVVNKPYNMLTIANEKEKEHTLYANVSTYIKESNHKNKIFIIHRLDRETSGIIIFAKNESTKKLYQENWNTIVIYRGYTAIVEGILSKKQDTVTLKLSENKNFKAYVSRNGKQAITKYKVLKENKNYSLLDIEILTGRKNQIRATMEYLHHPIVGDKKYGSKDNTLKRVGLHAHKLIIKNPITNVEMEFTARIPNCFIKLIN